jgi:hypothetical protein
MGEGKVVVMRDAADTVRALSVAQLRWERSMKWI